MSKRTAGGWKQGESSFRLRQRVLSIPTIVSFLVGIAVIVFLVTRFNLDWNATWDNIRSINLPLYFVAFLLYYLSFGFRGWRWQLLARNAGEHAQKDAKLPTIFHFTRLILIGWFVNSVAYLRLGDVFRAYAFAQDSGGGFPWALGTILAERVIDLAAVFVLLTIAALTFSATNESNASDYVLAASAILLASLIMVLIIMKYYGDRLAMRIPSRLRNAYHLFQLGTLGSFKKIPLVFSLGLMGWLLEIGRLYFVLAALDMSINIPQLLIVSLGHALLSTVPTPGGVGVVEPGITGLLILTLNRTDAVSVTLVDRSITYISVLVLGGLVFLWRQIDRPKTMHWESVTM